MEEIPGSKLSLCDMNSCFFPKHQNSPIDQSPFCYAALNFAGAQFLSHDLFSNITKSRCPDGSDYLQVE